MRISSHGAIVAGHRGMPLQFPDNTLAGFRAAAEIVSMVELDVRRSVDGRWVLSHDPRLLGHVVSESAWETLAELDLGDGHHPALLDDVLEQVPDLRLDVEMKNAPTEPGFEPDHRTALEVAPRLRSGDVLTSFYWPTVDAVRERHPSVATGLLVGAGGSLSDAIQHAIHLGHELVAPHFSLLSEATVAAALEAGLSVATWTVNEPEDALAFASWGVSTIIADDILRISAALEDR